MLRRPLSSRSIAKQGWIGLALACSLLLLAGCEAVPRQERNSPSQATTSDVPDTGSTQAPSRTASVPAFLVNELRDGLIPSAPQLGDLVVRDDCLVFVMRGFAATPLWPAGSTLEATSRGLRVTVPGREPVPVPSKTSLPGAFVPLNSINMTRFDGSLPAGCPDATFAVAKS